MPVRGSRILSRAMGCLLLGLSLAPQAVPGATPTIPSPQEVFGFRIGDDYRLADYQMLLQYFRLLDERSDRLQLVQYGASVQGRPMILAIITAPENHRQLDRYQTIARRLALGEVAGDEEARQLVEQGKAVVWIDSGLHATEIAHAQHAIELAYQLVSRDDPEVRRILNNVILLLAPCVNPDGMDLVVHWYWEHQNLRIPELYQYYIGHDNNRDFIMFTQPETQAIARVLYREWFPQIVYNHHQSAPYGTAIFVPPFRDPFNFNIDPLIIQGIALVSSAMKVRFEQENKAGVVSDEIFSTWWNGGLRTAAYFHNMIGILTETGIADPAPRKILPPPERLQPRTRYPHPLGEREWHLRDSVAYMLTGSFAVLDVAARYRDRFLYNIYLAGQRAIEKGRTQAPYAYILPPDQPDPSTLRHLVNVLLRGGLAVYRLNEPLQVGKATYPAGSYLIPTAQPFRAFLIDLLEPQRHPNEFAYPGGPPVPPYDIAGWTLTYQMNVNLVRLMDPLPDTALERAERIREELPPTLGRAPRGPGFALTLSPAVNDAYAAVAHLLKVEHPVFRLRQHTVLDGHELAAGTFLIPVQRGTLELARQLARKWEVVFGTLEQKPKTALKVFRLRRPRVGLYDVYGGNMDEGWIRWLFDQYGFPYKKLWGARIRAGRLQREFDVIILPSGVRIGTEGTPLRATRRFRRLGPPPPGYEERVPMGKEGVAQLQRFVEQGGTLVALGSSAMMPIRDMDVPLRNLLMEKGPDGRFRPLPRSKFYCPGSVLEAEFEPAHPVAFGMPNQGYVFFLQSPTFAVRPEGADRVRVIARYPGRNPLKSGWIWGEQTLFHGIAMAEVVQGRGRILLIGPRVQFRGQPHGTFKILFNSVLYGASTPAQWP